MLLLSALSIAHASSTGIINRSATGCGSCHGASAAASTTVSFGAVPPTVLPGEAVAITLTVSSTVATRIAAGLNAAATGGVLSAGSNTKLQGAQITHPTPALFTAGAVTFDFTWTAPATEGQYTLTAAGNAVNNTGSSAGDGWNLATALVITVDDGCDDLDGDGIDTCSGDCDDDDPLSYPGALEVCDGLDNDCDTVADNDPVDPSTFYLDIDGDGYGTGDGIFACSAPADHAPSDGDCNDNDINYYPGAPESDCDDPSDYNCDGITGDVDNDGDLFSACEDCNDTDSLIYPGAPERCDQIDNDCDGTADNDPVDPIDWYPDTDGDGYGSGTPTSACEAPPSTSAEPGDCDDLDSDISPGAAERCDDDNTDEDCDSLVNDDDDSPSNTSAWYTDTDGDGFGAGDPTFACEAPPGTASEPADCDDNSSLIYPSALEVCDGFDNDCNTLTDDDPEDAIPWYLDADGDGYGSLQVIFACSPPDDYVAQEGDCNDSDERFYPGAPETDCEEPADYNCDGSIGEVDADNDGFSACEECDDNNPAVRPGVDEVCDGIDNDCDGSVDGEDAVDPVTFYRDTDLDGYGITEETLAACEPPDGYAAQDGDCDDTSALVSPGAVEIWYDGTDSDCDGLDDYDQDRDGHRYPLDCEDLDPAVNPGVEDPPCDEIDVDCDPLPDDAVSCAPLEPPPGELVKRNGCGCDSAPAPGAWLGLIALSLCAPRRGRAVRGVLASARDVLRLGSPR